MSMDDPGSIQLALLRKVGLAEQLQTFKNGPETSLQSAFQPRYRTENATTDPVDNLTFGG